MPEEKRTIVIPSQLLGDTTHSKAGRGTFIENGKIPSLTWSKPHSLRYLEKRRNMMTGHLTKHSTRPLWQQEGTRPFKRPRQTRKPR